MSAKMDRETLGKRPGIFFIGSPNVGKRTLISCLSIDGDSQGVERLIGALSAHMWPGMLLKSGDKIHEPSLPDQSELSDEESYYEPEHEILSSGSVEPWDNVDGEWISADGPVSTSRTGIPSELDLHSLDRESGISLLRGEHRPSTSSSVA
ncbi:uncharacterized protein [Primulina eburnea]|uniref:uncharacterized protein isoform X3 n=1 Tax=Primulina eburnea TaxID=1245227 RepID=UPI003C6C2828